MRTIRASEIGEYVFCRRAWWLRVVQGHVSANVADLTAGTAAHAQHGRAVGASSALRLVALLLLAAAVAAGLWTLFPSP
jgi:hypothetical protein